MTHSEFSITNEKSELLQIWFIPPENSSEPKYKKISINETGFITVYGGYSNTL